MKSRLDMLKMIKKWHVCVLAVVLLLSISIGIYDLSNKKVTIIVDDKKIEASTFSKDVAGLLREKGVKLSKNDMVKPSLDEKLSDGMDVKVYRAFKVTLSIDGKTNEVLTAADTVEKFIRQQNIKLGEKDKVDPSLGSSLKPGSSVKVVRIEMKQVQESKEIPYKVTVVGDDSLEAGKTKVVQKGKAGQKSVTYEVVLEDGVEVDRRVVDEKLVSAPAEELVKRGTKSFVLTSRGETRDFKSAISMVASAYTAGYESTGKNPGDRNYGVTRSGTRVRPGVVSVDPRVIPLGSKLYIEPLGIYCIAEDTGSAIKGNRIDIYMESLSEARSFGKRNVKVYILK